jgi:hypothetical protein
MKRAKEKEGEASLPSIQHNTKKQKRETYTTGEKTDDGERYDALETFIELFKDTEHRGGHDINEKRLQVAAKLLEESHTTSSQHNLIADWLMGSVVHSKLKPKKDADQRQQHVPAGLDIRYWELLYAVLTQLTPSEVVNNQLLWPLSNFVKALDPVSPIHPLITSQTSKQGQRSSILDHSVGKFC